MDYLDMSSDNDLAVKQLNDFSVFLSYKMTWLMRQALLLPYKYDRLCLFCGNQLGKSAYMAYNVILRFLGSHPCPRKNVLYFECKNGHEFTRPAPWPGFHNFKIKPGQCFWTKNQNVMPKIIAFPQNMVCPECGEAISIHKRGTHTFRMASENLPEDKEGSGADSAEIRNRT